MSRPGGGSLRLRLGMTWSLGACWIRRRHLPRLTIAAATMVMHGTTGTGTGRQGIDTHAVSLAGCGWCAEQSMNLACAAARAASAGTTCWRHWCQHWPGCQWRPPESRGADVITATRRARVCADGLRYQQEASERPALRLSAPSEGLRPSLGQPSLSPGLRVGAIGRKGAARTINDTGCRRKHMFGWRCGALMGCFPPGCLRIAGFRQFRE